MKTPAHMLFLLSQQALNSQAVTTEVMEDGSVKETMGSATRDLLGMLKKGNKVALGTIKQNGKFIKNFRLLILI